MKASDLISTLHKLMETANGDLDVHVQTGEQSHAALSVEFISLNDDNGDDDDDDDDDNESDAPVNAAAHVILIRA